MIDALLTDRLEQTLRNAHTHYNLSGPELVEAALTRNEAILTCSGALRATTGRYTGRSPKDKYIVQDSVSARTVEWGPVNQPLPETVFQRLYSRALHQIAQRGAFVFDGFAGADPKHRLPIRVVTELAWHNLFARQLFVRPDAEELALHEPAFTVVDLPSVTADPVLDGTRSETFVVISFAHRMVLIGGTEYAGEIKKSIFSVLNYLLPERRVLPMHCSANMSDDGSVALFFGLSGTGKTTLSADPERRLIGDDEHGWSDEGVFNFEGGCYAKCIGLSPDLEPQIWRAIRFGTVLENVDVDTFSREEDYDSSRLTENTRAAYPIEFVPQAVIPGIGGHPKVILFLTADASGVLPPIAKLNPEQAMYHFLSGYTSKLAGTERGVTAPESTFSTCFGAPFLPLPAMRYAQMLGERMQRHGTSVYLVNTGWTGGPYGTGSRIALAHTRTLVRAAIAGELEHAEYWTDPVFGLAVPKEVAGVPRAILNPRSTWPDPDAYDAAAQELARQFSDNFSRFRDVPVAVRAAGP